MTEEILIKANKLQARIKEIDNILKQIEATNTMTGEEMTLPICIQAGIQNPVEFYIGEEFSNELLHDTDKAVYEEVVKLLTAYRDHIYTIFRNIRDY